MTRRSRTQRQKRTQQMLAPLHAGQYTFGAQAVFLKLGTRICGTRARPSAHGTRRTPSATP